MASRAMVTAFSINFSSPKLNSLNKPLSPVRFQIPPSVPAGSLKFSLNNLPLISTSQQPTKKHGFQLHSTAETVTVEEKEEEAGGHVEEEKPQKLANKRKLFVLNLPWSFSVADIKKLFGECGIVSDVEIIKQKDGKNRGFAFVTMASGEEAQAAIEKYDSFEVSGRIIRVQFSRRFKRPIPAVPAVTPSGETRHKLYVSNLAWKARSNHLRELFSSEFNPVSVRVVFASPEKSAGYGFVSFATKEEAESAISALDGKELMGRPIRLKFSERNIESSESKEEEPSLQQPPQESELQVETEN